MHCCIDRERQPEPSAFSRIDVECARGEKNNHVSGCGSAALIAVCMCAPETGELRAERVAIGSRGAPLDRRVVITALGIAQIPAWGTSFYFPAVFAERSCTKPAGRSAGLSAAPRSGCWPG
jgi:hypothetical protein